MQLAVEGFSLTELMKRARDGARGLASTSTSAKNAVLCALADRIEKRIPDVLAANGVDMERGRASGMEVSLLDRLLLTEDRVHDIAADVRRIAELPDPVGEEFDLRVLANGIRLSKRRVPIGVIGVVYEARPNVTIDVSALCIKSGNAVVLRGGKEALASNDMLVGIVREALTACHVSTDAVQFVSDPDRGNVRELIQARGMVDLVVPRGGASLIEFVREHARVPVLAGGIGVCHTYVHEDANLDQAVAIVNNAKTRRPSVCNALDTVLVHRRIAPTFLGSLAEVWSQAGVEMLCCPESLAILEAVSARAKIKPAHNDDFGREFLSLRAAVRVVGDLDEAIDHIQVHGSGHSEAIVTDGYEAAMKFVDAVDAAAVYVNASTGFTDGSQFGLGAEIGISTQKFHARGPLGLTELTSYKWVAMGQGQVRS